MENNREQHHPQHHVTLIEPQPMRGFVQTDAVKSLTNRALNYMKAGYPVHFRGPTGTGKTTLALHIARKLKQPVVLMHGDDRFTSEDLVGRTSGYSKKSLVDEFVRGVSKTEETMSNGWSDERITVAVRHGYTLLYDEFTRSRPEANNILLSILQEGMLDLPVDAGSAQGSSVVSVHPNFRAIFTSNPEEYAGVHKTQDALLDRMITLDLEPYDRETEIKIIQKKARLKEHEAEMIIHVVRKLRPAGSYGFFPTLRGCLMVAKSVKRHRRARVAADCPIFRQICHDVFIAEMARNEDRKHREALEKFLHQLIDQYCQVLEVEEILEPVEDQILSPMLPQDDITESEQPDSTMRELKQKLASLYTQPSM
jgi:nitric oxide reductase NorQ protein